MKPAIITIAVGGVLVGPMDVSPCTPPSIPIGVGGALVPCVLARISRQGLVGDYTTPNWLKLHSGV